jgi:hypothetical protein
MSSEQIRLQNEVDEPIPKEFTIRRKTKIYKKKQVSGIKIQACWRGYNLRKELKKPNDMMSESNSTEKNTQLIINKGTGAGGANTNYYGKKFEENTNNQQRLLENGYTKNSFTKKIKKKAYDYYLLKTFEDKTIVFVLQNGLKMYMKNKYNIDLFRCPDEAYIIEYTSGRKVIKILEKKEQNVEGSVETKLWSGPSLKREYEIVLGEEIEVVYGFCVSDFLKNKLISNEKKYKILNTILNETNIAVLFGDDENYFETFDTWFNNSL